MGRMPSGAGWLVFLVSMLMAATSPAASTVYFKVGDDLKVSCEGTAAGEVNASTAEYLLCLGYLQAVVDTDATFAEWNELHNNRLDPSQIAGRLKVEALVELVAEKFILAVILIVHFLDLFQGWNEKTHHSHHEIRDDLNLWFDPEFSGDGFYPLHPCHRIRGGGQVPYLSVSIVGIAQ